MELAYQRKFLRFIAKRHKFEYFCPFIAKQPTCNSIFNLHCGLSQRLRPPNSQILQSSAWVCLLTRCWHTRCRAIVQLLLWHPMWWSSHQNLPILHCWLHIPNMESLCLCHVLFYCYNYDWELATNLAFYVATKLRIFRFFCGKNFLIESWLLLTFNSR